MRSKKSLTFLVTCDVILSQPPLDFRNLLQRQLNVLVVAFEEVQRSIAAAAVAAPPAMHVNG